MVTTVNNYNEVSNLHTKYHLPLDIFSLILLIVNIYTYAIISSRETDTLYIY